MMLNATLWAALAVGPLLAVVAAPESARSQHGEPQPQPLQPFDAVYFDRSRSFEIPAAPEAAFPLFTPDGRARWGRLQPLILHRPADGWQGAVFRFPTHHGQPGTSVVADYDEAGRRIRYVTFLPESEAWEMEIRVEPSPRGSEVTVTYRVTALTESANADVTEFFERDFASAIDRWAPAIERTLKAAAKGGE
jgi:Polyketide cyclase / dehydrase and lipid transport